MAENDDTPIILVAGNQNQAFGFVADNKLVPGDYLLATHAERIKGRHGHDYILIGTYYERPDLGEVLRELRAHGCKELGGNG